MNCLERYEERQKKLVAEVNKLVETTSMEDLEKRFFRNFGCINFKSDEYFQELNVAHVFHDFHKRLHPELHDVHEETPYSCYHVTKCKCGFQEAYDSGD